MEPTISPGDIVFANTIIYKFRSPRVGEVVIVKDPHSSKHFVKRIEWRDGKNYFVIGDNKEESTDSRDFGSVPKKLILGKVM